MRNVFTIFNCWQSDDMESRNIIRKALNTAKQKLAQKGYETDIIEGAAGELGMAKIDDAVLKNIRDCDVFVCDLTPVTQFEDKTTHKVKAMPNSNVLIEMGYAMGMKGYKRMIGVAREGEISLEHMPFDIRQMRYTSFKDEKKLNKMAEWIAPMFDEILRVGASIPEYSAVVMAVPDGTEIEVHPSFLKLVYAPDGHDSLPCDKKKKVGANMWVQYSPVFDSETYKNYSLVPIRLVIHNNGTRMLENCKLRITCDDNNVHFEDGCIGGGIMSFRRNDDLTTISDRFVTHLAGNINPKDDDMVGEFYLKSDFKQKDITLKWSLSTHIDQSFEGTITVHWMPNLVDYPINFNLRHGESDIIEAKLPNK